MDLKGSTIPLYTGDSSQSFLYWRRKFEDYLALHGTLPSARKAARLRYFLDGMARDSFEDLPNAEQEDYTTAIMHLQNTFVTKNTKKQAKLLLKSCVQQAGESIPAFATRLRQLVQAAAADMPEEIKAELMLDSFIENLEPDLSYQVQLKFPNNFQTAFEIALQIQELTKPQIQEPTSFFVYGTAKANKPDLETRLDKLEAILEQLVINQLKKYHNQSDIDWHGPSYQPQYNQEELWNNGPNEYDDDDQYGPGSDYVEHGAGNAEWHTGSNTGWH